MSTYADNIKMNNSHIFPHTYNMGMELRSCHWMSLYATPSYLYATLIISTYVSTGTSSSLHVPWVNHLTVVQLKTCMRLPWYLVSPHFPVTSIHVYIHTPQDKYSNNNGRNYKTAMLLENVNVQVINEVALKYTIKYEMCKDALSAIGFWHLKIKT